MKLPQKITQTVLLLSTAAICSSIFETSAAPLPVVNPGFENITGETIFNEFTFGALNGWSLYDPGNITSEGDGPNYYIGTLRPWIVDPTNFPGIYNSNFPAGPPEGQRVAIAFNTRPTGGQGIYGFSQTLTNSVLQSNTAYRLQVEIGNIGSGFASNNTFFLLAGFPGYRVELLAGGVVVAQDNNSLNGSIPEATFATSTVTLNTTDSHPQLGQTLSIRLINLNVVDLSSTNSDLEVDFDHVRLDATPFTHALAAFRASQGLATNGSQDNATPASDGVSNLQKYAFNMIGTNLNQRTSVNQPNSAFVATNGSAGLPLVTLATNNISQLQIIYIRRRASSNPGVSYEVQFSETLEHGTWASNTNATESAINVSTVYERVTVTDSVTNATRRFARVRVTAQ